MLPTRAQGIREVIMSLKEQLTLRQNLLLMVKIPHILFSCSMFQGLRLALH